MADDLFCDKCGVSLDLHDGDDEQDCRNAERRAELIEGFWNVAQ